MGHSAGGVFTQLMLDRGYGAVGVAINSAPTEGVPVVPLSQLKSTFPVLRTVGRKKAAGFTLEQWRYAFTNTFTEEESKALYQRYQIPASVRVLWGSALATLEPGHQDTFVNYDNDDRAPLLFISGGEDHLMPPSVQRSNAKHYKSNTVTEVKEYPGYAHLLPAQKGWEQIADDALSWAVEHARSWGCPRSGSPTSAGRPRCSRSAECGC
jgi:pimeloyl-ACP methyl ester carboxylesterase